MKTGRNEPCPCGSGKKFKRCCIDSPSSPRSGDYFRLKGENAEATVHELARRSFFTDWCYPNPKWPDGKELCDLLVVFDGTAIICQVKDLELGEDGQPNQSGVEKNLRQLAGARRHLFDLRKEITLENPRRGPEPFDPTATKEVFLLSVLMGPATDYMPFAEQLRNHTVHVLDRGFLEDALRELDTISDFTAYLRAKEQLFRDLPNLAVMGGERELLAYYILHGRSFAEFSTYHGVVLDHGFWDQMKTHRQYLAKKKEDEISYGWDSMIDDIHEGSPEYEPVARELARPNRFLRRYLAKVFFDAHLRAHRLAGPNCNVYRRVLPADVEGVTYVFVFQECPEGSEARPNNLYATCLVARGRFPQNRKVVGIATEMTIRSSCSYSYCVLDLETLSEELEQERREYESRLGILQQVQWGETREAEYPALETPGSAD